MLAVLGAGAGTSVAAQTPQICPSIPDLYTASTGALQACGLTRIPQSSTTALAGGGVKYNYQLADGQTYSTLAPPSGFNASTVSTATAQQYGLPAAPPTSSPGYALWQQMASAPWVPATDTPYLVVSDSPVTEAPVTTHASASPAVSSPNWAGYTQAGSGWTESEAVYNEPAFGHTNCSNPTVAFWTGVGNQSNALGQDGTISGSQGLHRIFYENLPGGAAQPGPTVTAGHSVVANTHYLGSNNWSYDIYYDGANHPYGGTGGYDGSVVEDITERLKVNNSYTPLLNFNYVIMQGYTGVTLQNLAPTKEWDMTGFATTGPATSGRFQVTQNNCAG